MGANGNNNPDPNQNTDPTQSSGSTGDTTGGGSDNSNAFAPWAPPNPQSTFGVNSTVVYGEGSTAIMGPNNSITYGNNAQFCIDPASLAAQQGAGEHTLPGFLKQLASKALMGGNLSFTIGANTNVVLGPSYEVLWGGKKALHIGDARDPVADKDLYTADTLCKKTNAAFGGSIGALITAWFIAFGVTGDENSRLEWLLTLHSVLSIVVSVMVGVDVLFDQSHTTLTDVFKELFISPDPKPSAETTQKLVGKGVSSILAALVEPVILPSITSAGEENHWGSTIS